jgi:hypothetical protein
LISQCALILLFGFDVSLARADLMGRKQLLTAVRDRTRDAVLEGIEFLQVTPCYSTTAPALSAGGHRFPRTPGNLLVTFNFSIA